jgi:hypothetical protein
MHCIVTDFQTAYFQTAAVPKKSGVHGFIGNSLSRPEMCYLLDALFRNDLPQLPCPQSPKSAPAATLFISLFFSLFFFEAFSETMFRSFPAHILQSQLCCHFLTNVLLIK